jgi:hypothetical protein
VLVLRVDDSLAPSRLSRVLSIVTLSKITPTLVIIGGITYGAGAGDGLYWLVPAVLTAFFGGVFNAWALLIRLPVERPGSARQRLGSAQEPGSGQRPESGQRPASGQSPGSPGET